jgi:hypothetical protein
MRIPVLATSLAALLTFGAGVAMAQQPPQPNPMDVVPDKMPFDLP